MPQRSGPRSEQGAPCQDAASECDYREELVSEISTRKIDAGLRAALEPVLQVARSLAPVDRKAWLDELGRDAPALADAIERLVSADPADDGAAHPTSRPRPTRSDADD